jgi:hypothetical protein
MTDSEFVLKNPSVTIATEITMFIICIVGLFLNGLAVYITLFRHKSKNAATWLMLYIALADIMFSVHDISATISKWATSHQVMLNPWFCQSTGMFFTFFIMSSTDGVGLLSLLRALSIARNVEISAIYWYVSIGVLILINSILSIFAALNEVMRLMESEAYCQASFRKNKISKFFSGFMLTKYTIMLLIILLSYFCITIKFYQTASKLNFRNSNNSSYYVGDKPAAAYQRWVITRLLILVFMYMICFLPELIVLIYTISTNTQRSPAADAVVSSGIAFMVIVNSVFLLFYNQENRKILSSMLPGWIFLNPHNLEIQELNSL